MNLDLQHLEKKVAQEKKKYRTSHWVASFNVSINKAVWLDIGRYPAFNDSGRGQKTRLGHLPTTISVVEKQFSKTSLKKIKTAPYCCLLTWGKKRTPCWITLKCAHREMFQMECRMCVCICKQTLAHTLMHTHAHTCTFFYSTLVFCLRGGFQRNIHYVNITVAQSGAGRLRAKCGLLIHLEVNK